MEQISSPNWTSGLVIIKFWLHMKIEQRQLSELIMFIINGLVMPFGLKNAPTTFQSLMNKVFHQQLRKSVLVFFNDILVYNLNWPSHLIHLEEVLQILQVEKLFAKLSKCIFGMIEIDFWVT